MGLGDIYRGIEDKYYGFVDWLDARGISLYPLIDRIEEHKIPSFPIAIVLLALIVAVLVAVFGMLAMPQANVEFRVVEGNTGVGLEGALVLVTTASGAELSALTDGQGNVTIALPLGDSTVEVSKAGYGSKSVSLSVSGEMKKDVGLEKSVAMLSKTIQLMKAGTSQLIGEDVTVRFTCSGQDASGFEETRTSVSGTITLDTPGNCGSLIATPLAGFNAPNGVIDIREASPQLFLQAIETDTGTARASVESAQGEALAGITVMLYGSSQVLAGTQYTSAAGTAVFESVPTGSYYAIVHDSQGRYADFDSSSLGTTGVKMLVKDATISFDVELEPATVGTIKAILKDSKSRLPVENAAVYLKKGGLVVDTAYSDSEGVAEFNVNENVAFGLEVDASAYLIAVVGNVKASASFNEIFLEPATADNTQVLRAEVLDSRQKPVDGTRLVLKKADGTIYANNVVTGADGTGDFTNLPLGTYYVYAVKKGFEGKNSDPVALKARQENKVRIVLPIGFGNLEVLVLNDELQPVQGAVVEAVNALDNAKEQEEITGLDGKSIFNFRADKKVFFRVDAEGFLPYYSIAVMPDADSTVTAQIGLAKDPGVLQVRLLGLYLDGEKAPKELVPGQKYTARLLLLLPKNSRFDGAGLHLRVGNANEGKTNIMEEDSLYIRNVFASTAIILRGTSFTPPLGYAVDSEHLTTGDSKWVNLSWKNASQGAYAVEAEVQVKDSAQLGQLLYINYRGWGKAASYTRFPVDAALANAESTPKKQALYANTEQEVYTAGPSSLCGASFCKTFGIEDVVRNLRVSVIDQYNGAIGSVYRLHFTVTSTAEQAFTDSRIEFGSKGDGLRFGDYAITDATGLRSEGKVNGYLLSKSVGNLRKGSSVFGFIDFKTEKEGSNILTIVMKSNNQPVLSEAIDVRVEAAEQLRLDIIPKEIIPMIDNRVLVRVSDEGNVPVSNAVVTVMLNDAVVLSTESNGSGVVEFKLEMPSSGSTLAIKAEKTGYKAAELEQKIDSSILTVTPPKISEKLDIALTDVERQIWLNNQTVTDLTVSKLKFSSDFGELVEFEWVDDYEGEKINADSDVNVLLSIRLTEKGTLVEKPVKLEGSLSIHVLSPELQQTFVENIPVEIRIGLGGEVDSTKCLGILPVKWEILASSETSESQEFTLKNSCTVENTEIGLSGLSAKVSTSRGSALGTFRISSEDLGVQPFAIGSEFASFADMLPAGFEGRITIEFVPDNTVESGTSKPKIEFRAVHATLKAEESVSASLPVEVSLSNLAKCVEVLAEEPLELETTPLNTGYGNYGTGGGIYNPYYQGGYGGYGGTGGYGAGAYGYGGYGSSGIYGGQSYPYTNFSSPYYTNYYDTQYDNSWKYGLGQNNFIVKNNCASAVEIDLDVPSMLHISEEKLELPPNSDATITVESGYRMGKYEVGVNAKAKGSEDKAVKVDSIDVIVKRAGEMDEECIQLSTNKIELNDFIGKPVKTSIYNYCYDVGVRLPSGGNVIEFNCKVAGQPMNTYKFSEEEEETTASFQTAPYNNPFAQPSSYINQGPGMYGGESYAQTGPFGSSAYVQGNLGSQGYNYPSGAFPYGSNNWAQSQVGGYTSGCELIDSVYVTDSRTSGSEDGKTIQTVDFEVKPALNYRKMLCEFQSQMPFQTLFGLRVMLSQAYYRVFVDAFANVKYYNPFGGAANKYFQIELQDLWGMGDTIDECMYNAGVGGMPIEKLQKCREDGTTAPISTIVNTSALDLSTKGYQKGFIPQGSFGPNDTYIYTADPNVINIPPASGKDGIVEIMPREIVHESGVRLIFEPVKTECPAPYPGGNWTIKMTVDRSGMDESIGCAIISTQIAIKVTRPLFWETPKEAVLPVRLNVLNKNQSVESVDPRNCSKVEPLPSITLKCASGGEYGEKAYDKYGFDKLPFDWSWEGIDKQQCDEKAIGGNESFCDAVQFSIELNKKAEELMKFVVDNESLIKDNESFANAAVNGLEGCNPPTTQCATAQKDSANLYRFVKKQVKVSDNSTPGHLGEADKAYTTLFFLKQDNSILESENKKSLQGEKMQNAKTFTDAGVKTGNMYAIVESTLTALNSITDKADQRRVLGIIKKGPKESADYQRIASLAGIDKPVASKGAAFDNNVITLMEYRELNAKLFAALKGENKSAGDKCYDGANIEINYSDEASRNNAIRCTIGSVNVTAAGLNELNNAIEAFVVGTIDAKENEMKDSLSYILKNAGDADKLNNEGFASFADLYYKDIDFSSFLIKDAYNKDLRADFAQYFSESALSDNAAAKTVLGATGYGAGNWSFNGKDSYALGKPGLYGINLGIDFSTPGIFTRNVSFNKPKELKEIKQGYEKNYLFSMPFDGSVGIDTGNGRQEYGVVIENDGSIALAYDEQTKSRITSISEPKTIDRGKAFSLYSLQTSDALLSTNSGPVFSAVEGKIVSNSSKPARVDVKLSPRPGTGNEGIVYDLLESGFAGAMDPNTWFMWQGAGKTFSDQSLSRALAQTLCPEVETSSFHGFLQDIGTETSFKGLIILPFEKEYELQLLCNQGSMTANALGSISATAGWRKGQPSNQLNLNTTADKWNGTLKHFVESIESGKMCVTPGENSIALNWNKEFLLQNVSAGQQ